MKPTCRHDVPPLAFRVVQPYDRDKAREATMIVSWHLTSTLRAWWRAWRRREQAWRRRRGWAPVRDAEFAARFRALWKVTP
jgi:hypothetical protein